MDSKRVKTTNTSDSYLAFFKHEFAELFGTHSTPVISRIHEQWGLTYNANIFLNTYQMWCILPELNNNYQMTI